jgi:hypothetical protein
MEEKQNINKMYKEEEINLNDLDFKTIDLSIKNSYENDYYFLSDNLSEILKDKLRENKIKIENNDFKIYYSLSYSQGDGFCFIGQFIYKNCLFKVEHYEHYYHYNSKTINLVMYKDKYIEDLTEKQFKKYDLTTIEEEFSDLYVDICKQLEEIGYNIIEEEDKQQILNNGLRDFCEINNINHIDLYDLSYNDTEKGGFIKICESGDTCIKGLWIKNIKLKVKHYIKATIEDYKEISF